MITNRSKGRPRGSVYEDPIWQLPRGLHNTQSSNLIFARCEHFKQINVSNNYVNENTNAGLGEGLHSDTRVEFTVQLNSREPPRQAISPPLR